MQAVVIAPDVEERDFLSFLLRQMGLSVAKGGDVTGLNRLFTSHAADLVVLALEDSPELLSIIVSVRALSPAPLVLLLDAVPESRHCKLLDVGVDWLTQRPFSPRLFTRYTRMLLRRGGTIPVSILKTIRAGHLSLDPDARQITVGDGKPLRLTPLEFRLLYLFMTNREQVIPTETIVERVWGYSGDGNRELVRGLIRRLRRKIEPHSKHTSIIQNIPSVGYRFSHE